MIRWLEWGVRSYQSFMLGLSLVLFAVAIASSAKTFRLVGCLMGVSGFAYVAQGWVLGSEGFSQTESIAIVVTWVLSLAWMIWLVVVAWRMQETVQDAPFSANHP